MTKTLTRIERSALPQSAFTALGVVADSEGYDFVFYRPETGEIRQAASIGPHEIPHMQVPGCARLQAKADPHADYVNLSGAEPVVRPRPEIESLNALPVPTTVTVTCRTTGATTTHTVEDGSFEYEDLPGVYDVRVSAWPHHDAHFVLEITP